MDSNVLIHCPAGLALLAQTPLDNWRFETTPQPGLNGRRGYQPRGKVLGGSSSINAMVYARGHRSDYDHWAAEGQPGWSFDEVGCPTSSAPRTTSAARMRCMAPAAR